MNLSERLKVLANFIPTCKCLADIGTDHGYIPIYTVSNNISETAIASDIKKGPVKIAEKNIHQYGLDSKIETRIGAGLSILKKYEADVILISGMGGNLISDILAENIEIAGGAKHLILQPVQYPEELRKFLFKSEFMIIDEELAKEGNKYYHIIKAVKGHDNYSCYRKEAYYYIGIKLIEKQHPLLIDYVNHKINRFNQILLQLDNSNNYERKNELIRLKNEFEEVKVCLKPAMK